MTREAIATFAEIYHAQAQTDMLAFAPLRFFASSRETELADRESDNKLRILTLLALHFNGALVFAGNDIVTEG